MAGTIKSTIKNCSESFATSYSTAGTPFSTNTIFTKTFTSDTGFVFVTPPTVDFNGTSNKGSYSFTVVDTPTDGVKNKNLTSRAFTVNYTYGLTQPANDVVKFFASGTRSHSATTTNIYGYDLDTSSIKQGGEQRDLLVYGDPGVSLSIEAKLTGGSNLNSTTSIVGKASSNSTVVTLATANSKIFIGMSVTGTGVGAGVTVAAISGKTLTLSAAKSLSLNTVLTIGATGSFTATLDNSGKFILPIFFPRVSSASNYTITLTEIAAGSFSSSLSSPTSIIIYQYINTTFTLSATDSTSKFVLTGSNLSFTGLGNSVQKLKNKFFFRASIKDSGVNHQGAATVIPIRSAQDVATNLVFNTSQFTGVSTFGNSSLTLNNGAEINVETLEVELNQGTTKNTSGSTTSTAVTLSSANAAIVFGMRVTGTGINNIVTVAQIVGTSLVLSGVPGGTIGHNTTLRFHSTATLSCEVTLTKFGGNDDSITIPANVVVQPNIAPSAASLAAVSITSNEATNITLPTATNPDGGDEYYIITQLPQTVSGNSTNGTLKYTFEGTTTTISSVPHALPGTHKIVAYTRAADSTAQTDFKFKVNDGFQDSVEYSVIMNLS